MRLKSDSSSKKDQERQPESPSASVKQGDSWELIDMSQQKDQAGRLMQNLFGEALAKLQYMIMKDKKKFDKLVKEKRHVN
jgi:hypothetical protein